MEGNHNKGKSTSWLVEDISMISKKLAVMESEIKIIKVNLTNDIPHRFMALEKSVETIKWVAATMGLCCLAIAAVCVATLLHCMGVL